MLPWAPPKAVRTLTELRNVAAGLVVGALCFVPIFVAVAVVNGPSLEASIPLVVPLIGLLLAVVAGRPVFRSPTPFIWDNGNTRTNVPEELDRSTWYIPGGLLLGWAIQHDHLDPRWRDAHAADIDEFLSGTLTAPQLYRRVGGILADDILDEDANRFFFDYLGQRTSGFDRDLAQAFPRHTYFTIPDDANSQRFASLRIEGAFEEWSRHRWTRRWRRFTRPRGAQSQAWAAVAVQQYRRRRWLR